MATVDKSIYEPRKKDCEYKAEGCQGKAVIYCPACKRNLCSFCCDIH